MAAFCGQKLKYAAVALECGELLADWPAAE